MILELIVLTNPTIQFACQNSEILPNASGFAFMKLCGKNNEGK